LGFAPPDHCERLNFVEDSGKIRVIARPTRRLSASGTEGCDSLRSSNSSRHSQQRITLLRSQSKAD
jgi:hypothetical protein